jgi:hypothetical protein
MDCGPAEIDLDWPDEALALILRWMPLKADRGLPGELLQTLCQCGWTKIQKLSDLARPPAQTSFSKEMAPTQDQNGVSHLLTAAAANLSLSPGEFVELADSVFAQGFWVPADDDCIVVPWTHLSPPVDKACLSLHDSTRDSKPKIKSPRLGAITSPRDDITHEAEIKLLPSCYADLEPRTYMTSPDGIDREASTNTPSSRDIADVSFDGELADESVEAISVASRSLCVTRNRKMTPQLRGDMESEPRWDEIESDPEVSDEAESRQPVPKSVFSGRRASEPLALAPATRCDTGGPLLAMFCDRDIVTPRSKQPQTPKGDIVLL